MITERYQSYLAALLQGIENEGNINNKWLSKANEIMKSSNSSKVDGLTPIFSSIALNKEERERRQNFGKKFYYSPTSLNLTDEKTFFPTSDNISNVKGANQTQLNLIQKEKEQAVKEANAQTVYTLYHSLFKHAARLPSANTPEVGLFDENRLRAGLVNCLSHPQGKENDYLLIKGDLSGIQKFIYSEIDMSEAGNTAKLSKKLRGRSFYIAMLTDFIVDRFADAFEVAQANVIYSGGGHFLMLLPNIEGAENILREKAKEINQFLLKTVGTRIALLVGATKCGNDIFANSSKYIQEVNDDLSKNKFRKHHDYLGELFYDDQQLVIKNFTDDEEIGGLLPYSRWIVEIEMEEESLFLKAIDLKKDKRLVGNFPTFHRYFFMLEKDNVSAFEKLLSDYQEVILSVKINALNHTDFLKYESGLSSKFPKIKIGYGFKFMGCDAPKDKKGDVLEFKDLSKLCVTDNEELGFPLLAVARLDVDNLGTLFAFGMGQSTFARTATLSRELYLFFNGYLNELAKEYQIYVVYSGGDDAFVVGSWINIVHFLDKLREKFHAFCCENESLSFSAGVFLCNEHYPVAKFAQKSENAEKRAKNMKLPNGDKAKNAICVFDHTLSFPAFSCMLGMGFNIVNNYIKDEEGSIEKRKTIINGQAREYPEKVARSLMHRLLRMIKTSIKEKNGERCIDSRTMYRNSTQMHYLFARQGFTNEVIEGEIQKGIVKDVVKTFLTSSRNKDVIANFQIPTTYVVYKTRTLNK